MATSLLSHGFEIYVRNKLFLILKHEEEKECNKDSVKRAIRLVKGIKRKFTTEAKRHCRQRRFYGRADKVLDLLMKDLTLALSLYKDGLPKEAYPYVQWARIRAYDIRQKF